MLNFHVMYNVYYCTVFNAVSGSTKVRGIDGFGGF